MRIDFDFLDLEAFLAVRETGSFHGASERLNLSQSSVTRRVQKLEAALGTQLFERTTRAVHPTLAAKRLHLRAEAILQEAQDTARAMRDESAAYAYQRARTVTVATIPTVVAGLIGPALRACRAAGQGARIRLLDLAANEAAEAVAQGEADFGICSIPMLEPATDFVPLLNDPMRLAVPQDHRFAQAGQVAWRDLAQEALILPARGTGNRLLIDEALARSRTEVAWTYEVGRSHSALDLVAAGVGVAPLPRMMVAGDPAGRVHTCALVDPEVSRPIGLISRMGQSDSPSVAALKRALVDAARAVAAPPFGA